jgi:[acyl-carrier-protein] S-malonyltransferase
MGIALVFPGQGSQQPGMAVPWQKHPAVAAWQRASEVLGWDVARLGTDADEEELREPRACQVALFVHHLVLLEAWRASGGEEPAAVAGHSLGEYDALVAAAALDADAGLKLVDARARLTSEAALANPGGMVACLGYDEDQVRAACDAAGAYLANDNAPGQAVVAGPVEALAALRDRLGEGGKVRTLKVGAAYHSPHMQPAVGPLGAALDATTFRDAALPVVANVDASPHTAASEWPDLLRRQVVAPVRWRESVTSLREMGVDEIVELGASPVLTGLVKRIDRTLRRRTVSAPEDL